MERLNTLVATKNYLDIKNEYGTLVPHFIKFLEIQNKIILPNDDKLLSGNKKSYNGFVWTLPQDDVLSDCCNGTYEPHLLNFIREFVQPGDTAMDIGACFGFHTLEMSRQVGESGHVYAFEPMKYTASILRSNLTDNNISNTMLCNYALGDINRNVCMYNAYDGKTNYGDSFISWKYTSIDTNDDLQEDSFIGKGGGSLPINKNSCECKTLDSLSVNGSVTFMKIDVQGFERMVLTGGQKFLSTHRPVMVIEFEDSVMAFHNYSSKDLIELLTTMNYTVMLLYNDYPCDHVCIPNEKLEEFYKMFGTRIHPLVNDNPINHNLQNGVKHQLVLV
ncbi:FkbM family methyltransferase [bacterium]|nr:FkbM family methyltransferase [bacterium]